MADQSTPKVTGIGGVFFKCKDPVKVKEWYKTHLGMDTNEWGASFEWGEGTDQSEKGSTQWSPFAADTDYFDPSPKSFMINYRVQNIEGLVEKLKAEGVTVIGDIASYSYGKFAHLLDCEDNKIELWEPTGEF